MGKHVTIPEDTSLVETVDILSPREQKIALEVIEQLITNRFPESHIRLLAHIRYELKKARTRNASMSLGQLREELGRTLLDACRESKLLDWIEGVKIAESNDFFDIEKIDIVVQTYGFGLIYLQCKSRQKTRRKHLRSQKNIPGRDIPCVVIREDSMSDAEILLSILIELLSIYDELCPSILGRNQVYK